MTTDDDEYTEGCDAFTHGILGPITSIELPGLNPGIWALGITTVDPQTGAEIERLEKLIEVHPDGQITQGPSL